MSKPIPLSAYRPEDMLALLTEWQKIGLLSALDVAFACFLYSNAPPSLATALSDNDNASTKTATLMSASGGGVNSTTLLLAALVSYQVSRGHVCLPLNSLADMALTLLPEQSNTLFTVEGDNLPSPDSIVSALSLPELLSDLKRSGIVLMLATSEHSGAANSKIASGASEDIPHFILPLVVQDDALYLYRYWHYEQQIATDLRRLMQPTSFVLPPAATLTQWLAELFQRTRPQAKQTEPTPSQDAVLPASNTITEQAAVLPINWQQLACVNTLRSQFSVITGGPGTGKTYTVVRLLALLQRLQCDSVNQPLVIKLAAPTGKAAARLKESIQAAKESLHALPAAWHSAIAQITAQSTTLHKLLGVQPGTRQFKHNRRYPLALDVLIVDEASMVDIELMQALLAALPPAARLILLGDKDQLASVEAGAVLGQLCAGADQGGYQRQTFDFLQQYSSTALPQTLYAAHGPAHLQHVVMLRESRRFTASSGIGALAAAVNNAAASDVAPLFADPRYTDIQLLAPESSNVLQAGSLSHDNAAFSPLLVALSQLCQQGFAAYWQAITKRPAANSTQLQQDEWARAVLAAYQGFQLLTPVRQGPFGVAGLNALVQKTLSFLPKGKALQHEDSWYEGRPIMITANDYNLNLRNGDVGMVLTLPGQGQKRAVFIDSDNQVRWILPSRLTQVDTVFAMTVHKSQGSEFAHTVMVMPERDNPVLSRELLYTGITRAAKQLTLVVPDWHVLVEAINRPTVRAGHLRI
ncbi:exodeoxyribonuclease V subunit alpha [Alishewanella tabrizica]|uniref:RecBCD enzyme subunit RecD n=1 Tax=Alishewanella tabrizica TaxID=671278 RepID=A0ABQ2WI85_9ALTE|nr:exodeoxyribonuclease V subunit alpha [Alishewanella tabrizica]GGW56864.1 RecBCD enzyme subunit RecD [Alishewanella tabrizica]